MSNPSWNRYGHLTPDAPECQRDVWAFYALVKGHLAQIFDDLAIRSAEPVFRATLEDGAHRARELRAALEEEAGEEALVRARDDDAVREWDGVVAEVASSGHVPSLLVCGYMNLGEVATVPLGLLQDVAGPAASMLCGRVLGADSHRPLARMLGVTTPSATELEQLRRLARHLNEKLAGVFVSWVQTFHTLGVDGEALIEAARDTVRTASHELGLKVTRADLGVFGHR